MKTYVINPNPTPGGANVAFADKEVHLVSPVRTLVLISSPSTDSHLYLHFQPCSKSAGVSPIPTTGQEPWVPLQGSERNFPTINFDKPISVFYMSGDSGASGDVANFAVLCSDDIISIEGVSAGGGSTVPNPIGVDIESPLDGSGNVKVAIENFPATQPVSIAATVGVDIESPLDGSGNVKVAIENFPATQPVSIAATVEVVEQGADNGSTGQLTLVANTAAVVVSSRTTRRQVMVTYIGYGPGVYFGIGGTAPTTANGDYLPGVDGASLVIPTNQEVQAISTGTPTLSYMEIYD